MFRRSKRPPAPEPYWQTRVDEIRAQVQAHAEATTTSVYEIDRVGAALAQADDDLRRLDAAIEGLDPDAATAELKRALRARVDLMADDTPLITSLRQRRETVIGLQNRRKELAAGIEATLADLDAFSAKLVELAFVAGDRNDDLGALVTKLNDDTDALLSAHNRLGEI